MSEDSALLVLVRPMNGGRGDTPGGGESSSGALANPDASGFELFLRPNGSRSLDEEEGMSCVDGDGTGERASEW